MLTKKKMEFTFVSIDVMSEEVNKVQESSL